MVDDLEVTEWREVLFALCVNCTQESDWPWCNSRDEEAVVVDHWSIGGVGVDFMMCLEYAGSVV